MKTKKYIKRIFSFILATVLLFSAIPVSLAVQEMLVEDVDAKIVREVTELREESVKHFLCEDGSYIAATYSAPVHYKENGEWKEIDNSLSLDRTTLSESGEPTYTTKAGGLDVSIPQDFSDEQKITAKNKGYEISFGLNANQDNVSLKKSASIVDVEALSSNTEVKNIAVKQSAKVLTTKNLSANDVVEKHNEEMMSADNQSSAVTFSNVFPNTDLEYIVSSSSIKENIVVYEPQNEYTYSFNMDFEGLIPVTHADGSISLVEPSDPDNFVFWIEAPYMYDANYEESIDIEMTLEENGDEYLLTLVASDDWINNESRVFPVVIDPTIYLSDSDINDVFVINGLYAGSPRVKNELRVGRNLTNVTRTYIKPTMPTNIPVGSKVSSAYLKLYQKSYYQALLADEISIRIYDCCNVATWKSHEVSWNNQPFDNSNNGYKSTTGAIWLASKTASDSASSYTFTITEAVQRWVNGGVNNGFMLASSDESTKTQVDLYSSRVSDSANHPDVWFTYSTPGVSQDSWYTESAADTSPTITVNSSLSWTATSSDTSWLTISNLTSSSFKIRTSDNPDTDERYGTIVVKMGNTTIGTITVTQSGSAPSLSIDKTDWTVDYVGGKNTITITSNTSWIITTPEWITATPLEGEGNCTVELEALKNSNNFERNESVVIETKVNTNSVVKTVDVFQIDKTSSYFNEFNDNDIAEKRESNQYIHSLATWSMELSEYAYNPFPSLLGHLVPGMFMETTKTAEAELVEKGFNVETFNYDHDDAVAHVIAHREITIAGTTRPLVVVVVRGSTSWADWFMNINTQLDINFSDLFLQFEDGADTVIRSLYGTNDSNFVCENCEDGCYYCEGFICKENIQNPIVLITGHSLGAAVANLVAHHFNSCNMENCVCKYGDGISQEDVYTYTFGTPYVDKEDSSTTAIEWNNIFNILNNNDLVPLLPIALNSNMNWIRHGRDFHITMPMDVHWLKNMDTAFLGLGGHAMSTYVAWMNSYDNISIEELMELCEDDVVLGIIPKLLKVNCPVSVTLYDSSGNIISYESQQEETIQPTTVEDESRYSSEVVSWITESGTKMFFIPYGYETIDVYVEAYDYGTMSLTVETIGAGEPISSKTFNDVALSPGKCFESEISSDVTVEDTSLFVVEEDGSTSEITELSQPFKGITAENEENIYGTPVRFNIVTDNTVTEIQLYNRHADYNMTLIKNGIYVNSVTVDGDNLIWNIGFYPNPSFIGENIYDISVKSGEVWYEYDNVISISVVSTDS